MDRLRPHHLLCTLGYQGKGYSPSYIQSFSQFKSELQDESTIQISNEADRVCAPCPHRRGMGCEHQAKVDRLDRAHGSILGVEDGMKLTWGECKQRIRERMTVSAFQKACADCRWVKLGHCESALRKLLAMLVLIVSFATLASQAPPEKVESPRVDDLLNQLVSAQKSRIADKVARGHQALAQKRFDLAKKFAAVLKKDRLYSDYGYLLEAEALIEESKRFFRAKKYDQVIRNTQAAVASLVRVTIERPDTPYAEDLNEKFAKADLYAALAYFRKKDRPRALVFFDKALRRLYLSKKLRGVMNYRMIRAYAMSCSLRPSKDPCKRWMNRLIREYPERSKEYAALKKYAPKAAIESDTEKTQRRFESYRSRDRDSVAIQRAVDLFLTGPQMDSVKLFEDFIKSYPKSKEVNRARFLAAQAYMKKRYREEAYDHLFDIIETSPLSYYGVLASIQASQPIQDYVDGRYPRAVKRDPDLNPVELERLIRAEELIARGGYRFAARELQKIRVRRDLSSPFLMYLASLSNEAGNYLRSFVFVQELLERNYKDVISSYGLRLIFPRAYEELVQNYSKEFKIDPVLAMSLIKQESAFRSDAISPSKAIGLMQLMSFTALDTDPNLEIWQLENPEVNVRVGSKHLASLLKKFQGNVVFSLAAYNAGYSRTKGWVKDFNEDWGMIEFIESISYPETRGYVMGILRNYHWYYYRLTGKKFTNLETFWKNPPNS